LLTLSTGFEVAQIVQSGRGGSGHRRHAFDDVPVGVPAAAAGADAVVFEHPRSGRNTTRHVAMARIFDPPKDETSPVE
jgi:hypothetical protein